MTTTKNMKKITGPRLAVAVLVGVAAAVVIGGVGYAVIPAVIPSHLGVIHGCYTTSGTDHSLGVVDNAVTPKCPSGSTALNWNADGSNGYSAQTSDTHLNDTLTQVASLTLPAGSYLINANAWLENDSPSNASSLGVCELVLGSATDEVEAGLLGPSSAPLNDQTLAMTVSATVTSATTATLSCEAVGNTGLTYADTASMTATQVGTLNASL